MGMEGIIKRTIQTATKSQQEQDNLTPDAQKILTTVFINKNQLIWHT